MIGIYFLTAHSQSRDKSLDKLEEADKKTNDYKPPNLIIKNE